MVQRPGIGDYTGDKATDVAQINTRGLGVPITIEVARGFERKRIGSLFGGYHGKVYLIPVERPGGIVQLYSL